MKKIISLMIVSLLLASFLPMICASGFMMKKEYSVNLYEKNPTNWNIVNGAYGEFRFYSITKIPNKQPSRRNFQLSAFGLNPSTSYQFVYYGFNGFNDVWNYATCIGSPVKTNSRGTLRTSGFYSYSNLEDGISQKYWLVLASDVNCSINRMTDWNPTEYLFEEATV